MTTLAIWTGTCDTCRYGHHYNQWFTLCYGHDDLVIRDCDSLACELFEERGR